MGRRASLYRQYLVWGLSAPLLLLNLWVLEQLFRYFEQVITITVLAAIVALLLNYPVQWLEKRGLPRLRAIVIVLLATLTGLLLLGFIVFPSILEQTNQLLEMVPSWLDELSNQLSGLEQMAHRYRLGVNVGPLTRQIRQFSELVLSALPGLAIGTLGRMIDTVFVLVLAVYMMLYGRQFWRGLLGLLPLEVGYALERSLQFNFQRFFIGQIVLALFMLISLVPIFIALRLEFALLFALIIGIFEIIPFVGATLGIGLVTLLSLLEGFWVAFWVAVAAIGLQQIRDNLIAPRLLGQFIGLNPIWILIVLLVGARVGGVFGVILAIPIAGTIKSTVEQLRSPRSSIVPVASGAIAPQLADDKT